MELIVFLFGALSVAFAGNVYYMPEYHEEYQEQQQGDYHNHAGEQYSIQDKPQYVQPQAIGKHIFNEANDYIGQHQANFAHGEEEAVKGKTPRILKYDSERDDHTYHFGYHTENGIQAHEVGQVAEGKKVEGAYSYVGDDGKSYTVTYIADEHGFRATGDHLPTPPPIPAAIYESLEKNAKDEASGIHDDGQYHGEHQSHENMQNYHGEVYHQPEHTAYEHSGYYN